MPSFTTLFRVIVMLAVGAGVFKGWQQYGPSNEQVKSVAMKGLEMAQTAWNSYQSKGGAQPSVQPEAGAPPFAQATQTPAIDTGLTAPQLSTQTLTSAPPLSTAPIGSTGSPMSQQSITPLAPVSELAPPSTGNDDRVHALLTRLEQLGGAQPIVAPWGSGGQLFRCSCQAPLANAPAVKQHFEAVAAEPALAVEQVVAKVEAWRTAQRDGGLQRY